ncbi:secreted protein [Colletotrichum asianum]|uniref:Secreted protein n=1 Tax=Colletotrichum asianum TaxID=702518 RepID=A0A8H3ZS12_9PEZI|nr:secreted protein [Colletotrichum asianum]
MRGLGAVAALAASLSTISQAQSLDDFASPPYIYRPKFRYWLPVAEVDIEAVTRDVAEIASVGAGGLEFLPYYQFRSPSANWSTYGYGINASRAVFRTAMQAAADNDLLFDFSIGANQGQGVPSEPESVGLALELADVNVTVMPGHAFNGSLPLSTQPASPSLHLFMHPCEEFGQQNLSFVLAVEQTTASNASSTALLWTPPEDSQNTWRIMAWYTRYTNQRSIDAAPDAVSWLQNGSWVTDHFSAAGAKKLTDFFDEYIIPEEEDKKLFARVGKYAWEDSMEMDTALWWTHDFADSFRTQRGYDIATCLPFLIQRENYWAAQNLPYGESFLSQDNNTLVSRYNDDYRFTLQHRYEKYIRTTSEWAHERGLEYSNQPAYNLPLNILDSIPLVNAPEGESLGFNDSPSLYRHLSGPAHMARNSVISSEAGAVNGASYTQTIQDLLRTVRRGLAVGTTWPGYTVFSYTFTDMWGPRMPAWRSRHNGENGAGFMADAMAYVARNQFISQIGTARVDLAFYQYAAPFAKVVYGSDNLEKLGFTYDYLGPASFFSSNAIVGEGGVLAPDGPAYKALIFANQTKLTPEMAAQTKAFAEAGLPIFVIGRTDFQSVGVDGAASVPEMMAQALAMESVAVLASGEELPAALAALDIRPRVAFSQDDAVEKWYTFSRSTEDAQIAFLYNDGGNATATNISFLDMAGRTPCTFDAWTGTVSPLLQYTIEENNIVVPVTLAANQTAILVFSNPTSASGDKNGTSILPHPPSTHITSISGPLKALVYTATQDVNTTTATNNTRITAHLAPGTATVSLATGQTLIFTATQLPEVTELDAWNITVNDWRSEDNVFSMETAILWVNGDKVIFDVNSSPDVVVDITNYLNPAGADNVVKVEVASTLYNRIRAEQDNIMTFGVAASVAGASFFKANPAKEYGLRGPVSVPWVEIVDVL